MKESIEQHDIPSRFPAEKSDKAMFIRRRLVDLQIHHVISFSGRLDERRMAKAVRLSLDAEPILGCKYIENWWQPYWQRREDLDLLDLCSMTEFDRSDQAILDYLTVPLDPRKDPLVQVKIFRSENDAVCIKVNHVITDGAGLLEYSHLLASIYQKLKVDANYRPEVNRNGSRNINQVLDTFNRVSRMKMVRRGFRNWKSDTFPRKNWQFPMHQDGSSKKTYVVRKISTHHFLALKAYGNEKGATVNQVIITAFYRAFYKIIGPSPGTPLRMGSTVSLRRYLPIARGGALCNLSGFMYLNIGSGIGRDFSETLSRVKKSYACLENDYMGLGTNRFDLFRFRIIPFCLAYRLCGLFSRLNGILSPQEVAPWVSNGGRISREQLNFGDITIIDSYTTAPPTNPPIFAVAITGFEKTMTVSIGISEPSIDKEEVVRLLDYVEEELAHLSWGKDEEGVLPQQRLAVTPG